MGRAAGLRRLTIEGTKVLLLEMPFAQWTAAMEREVRQIIMEQGLTVVLAHLERFIPLQKDKTVMDRILSLPLMVQVNTASLFSGGFLGMGKGKTALKVLADTPEVVLGSDCHSPNSRPVTIREGREVISKKLGDEILAESDAAAAKLLRGAKTVEAYLQ